MKIYKTWMLVGNEIHLVDTIEHAGQRWLVPGWLDRPSAGWSRPVRIILLDVLAHRRLPEGATEDYILEYSIPKDVFYGRSPPAPGSGFVVLEQPEIWERSPGGVQ